MVYIESESRDPYWNLALEEYVFEKMDPEQDYFMLWQNSRAVIVGKYQNTAEEIDPEYVDAHGIRVVRRLSGGGAVYHDDGNLNFTFIVGRETGPDLDFHLFVIPVLRTLEELGVHAEFNGRNDLTIDGKKFSGNSQYAKRGRVMHHGCIMLDSDLEQVQHVLRVKEAKFTSKSIKSVQSRVTTINDHAPERISMDTFRETLKKQVFAEEPMRTYTLTDADREAVEALAQDKYRTWEWNYGFSPDYSIRREKKFESGLVTVQMDVEHAAVREVRFFGDFFGNGEIGELEEALKGVPLDSNLAEKLEELHAGTYIYGVSAEELAELMR